MPFSQYAAYAQDTYTLPEISLRLRELLDSPTTDVQDIARLISIDPALTSKVLRLANSALFRFPAQIDNIARAINVVGGEAIYNLVIAETAQKAVFTYHNDLINTKQHWYKSVVTGVLAKRLAKGHARGTERFFVLGILYHLSEMIIAQHSPDAYQSYLNDAECVEPWQKQSIYFGFDFALCSGGVLQHWQLPLQLYAPLMDAHDSSQDHKPLEERLLCQAQAIEWIFNSCTDPEQCFHKASSLTELSLEYKELAAFYALAEQEALTIQSLF